MYSAQASDVDTVICDGKILMRKKCLVTIDEEETVKNAKLFAKRILG